MSADVFYAACATSKSTGGTCVRRVFSPASRATGWRTWKRGGPCTTPSRWRWPRLPALLIWPAIVGAPAALYVIVRRWRAPGSVVPRTRIRFYLAALFALGESPGRVSDLGIINGVQAARTLTCHGKSIYRRLTGRRRGFTGFTQLWLAPDHILLVQNNRFSEHYRRFALADIQAIVVTALPDRMPWQILALAASILWTLALFAVDLDVREDFFSA